MGALAQKHFYAGQAVVAFNPSTRGQKQMALCELELSWATVSSVQPGLHLERPSLKEKYYISKTCMEGQQHPQATLWGLLDPHSDPAPQLPTPQGLTCILAGFPSVPPYLRHSLVLGRLAGPQSRRAQGYTH